MDRSDPLSRERGLVHLLNACRWSWGGLAATFRDELAFRQELLLCAVLAPAGWWLGGNGVERAILIGSLFLLLIVELLNTAIESVVDRVGGAHHPLAGKAKDQGSAAVFVTILAVAVIWLLILLPD